MIDLHCHALPGIDDGPQTVEESVLLARAASQGGTRTIVATPHVSWRYANDAQTIARLVAEVNQRLAAEHVDLRVRAGAEVAMTRAVEMSDEQLAALTLGGGEWLLVECPFTPGASGFDRILMSLQGRGFGIVLAHPERCPAFLGDLELLRTLVKAGMLTSITASAFTGRFGRSARDFAFALVREQLAHNVASDAHDVQGRPPSIAAELESAGLGALREWLTETVPSAVLDGHEIPPRPPAELRMSGRRSRKPLWRRR
jgi:protein-tyrosine phosphatase